MTRGSARVRLRRGAIDGGGVEVGWRVGGGARWWSGGGRKVRG